MAIIQHQNTTPIRKHQMKAQRHVATQKLTAPVPNPRCKTKAAVRKPIPAMLSVKIPLSLPAVSTTQAVTAISAVATIGTNTAQLKQQSISPLSHRRGNDSAAYPTRSGHPYQKNKGVLRISATEALIAASGTVSDLSLPKSNALPRRQIQQRVSIFEGLAPLSGRVDEDETDNTSKRTVALYHLRLPAWCHGATYNALSDSIYSDQKKTESTTRNTSVSAAGQNRLTRRRSLSPLAVLQHNDCDATAPLNLPLASTNKIARKMNEKTANKSKWDWSTETLASLVSLDITEQGPPAYTAKPPSPPPAYVSPEKNASPLSDKKKPIKAKKPSSPASRLEVARITMVESCNPTVAWRAYRLHKLVAARAQVYRQLVKASNGKPLTGAALASAIPAAIKHLEWPVKQTAKDWTASTTTTTTTPSRRSRSNSQQWLMLALETRMILDRKIICPLKPRAVLPPRMDQTTLSCTMFKPSLLRHSTVF
ncbi:hypothetical protein BDF19DRAFT_427335 [Syncephalis fuscata]|nr:hypothetical protein BDF19DRAFT_427335 [Syncephalis fuscata]